MNMPAEKVPYRIALLVRQLVEARRFRWFGFGAPNNLLMPTFAEKAHRRFDPERWLVLAALLLGFWLCFRSGLGEVWGYVGIAMMLPGLLWVAGAPAAMAAERLEAEGYDVADLIARWRSGTL
jgi:hypothetical protein